MFSSWLDGDFMGSWEEDRRGKVPFSSYNMYDIYCQHELPLLMPWSLGWGSICQVFTLWSIHGPSPRHRTLLCGWKSLGAAQTSGVGYVPSWGDIICLSYLEFFSLPFIYINVKHLFISIWTHGYLFYTLVYNSTLLLFCCSDCSSLGHWNSLIWPLCPFSMLHRFVFWALFSGTIKSTQYLFWKF